MLPTSTRKKKGMLGRGRRIARKKSASLVEGRILHVSSEQSPGVILRSRGGGKRNRVRFRAPKRSACTASLRDREGIGSGDFHCNMKVEEFPGRKDTGKKSGILLAPVKKRGKKGTNPPKSPKACETSTGRARETPMDEFPSVRILISRRGKNIDTGFWLH